MILFTAPLFAQKTLVLINDEAVTTSNDSLETAWIDLGEHANQVSFWLAVDDTAHIKYYVDYKGSTSFDEYLSTTVDSIKTVGTSSSTLGKGITIRGFGTSAITNVIPGGRYIRFRGYRQSDAETTTTFRCVLIIRD